MVPKNCLAYDDKLSTYLRCPSAYTVSNAREDFPLPESPVKTTSLFLGISKSRFLRLCSRAPLIVILSIKNQKHSIIAEISIYGKHCESSYISHLWCILQT